MYAYIQHHHHGHFVHPSITGLWVAASWTLISTDSSLSLSPSPLCEWVWVCGCGCGCRRRCSFLLHYHYVAMDSLTHKSHMQTSWCHKQRELSMFSVCVKTTKQTVFSKSHTIKKKKTATKQTCYIYCNSNR